MTNNSDIQVQMVFTASDSEKDFKAPAVKYLMAIAAKNNEVQTKQVLYDWYSAEKKDYEGFAAKYQMDDELEKQGDKVKLMRDWCDKMGFAFTPKFFANGYQLLEQYSVSDLKY